jgi:hypothetical protein
VGWPVVATYVNTNATSIQNYFITFVQFAGLRLTFDVSSDALTTGGLMPPGYSHLCYRAQSDAHNEITLVNRSLDQITFWLTDDVGNLVTPAADWNLTLVFDVQDKDKACREATLLQQLVDLIKTGAWAGGHKRLREG